MDCILLPKGTNSFILEYTRFQKGGKQYGKLPSLKSYLSPLTRCSTKQHSWCLFNVSSRYLLERTKKHLAVTFPDSLSLPLKAIHTCVCTPLGRTILYNHDFGRFPGRFAKQNKSFLIGNLGIAKVLIRFLFHKIQPFIALLSNIDIIMVLEKAISFPIEFQSDKKLLLSCKIINHAEALVLRIFRLQFIY